ncbi:GNAT family N-acetyltransferase (plasmid) [Roseomonas gilardii subsp. gilardii]|uniref:GNAT family N-acetyltransferase n=1 Tax=Roseomonas gilardii TaxID=257708 RepID=UPI001FFB6F01|nr:GNAT family N-acetyltransferase [Roseomonas gilardii]UPG74733.1 GNAT family N-acetyltransferase [Roseomonas gilardii subsp. gilardii]
MTPDAIELTDFGEAHLDGALALSREARWPHRREDWAMVLSLSQGIVALRDGAVVGTAMMTPFGTSATINLVIVATALRGHGLGRRLMDTAIGACGARVARLIATPDGLPLYRKLGFRETHEIRQHQGIVLAAAEASATGADRHGPLWAEEADLAEIRTMDATALGMDRSALLSRIARDGRFAILRRDGKAAGYGAIRPFGRGEVAGPVVADSEASARAILRFLLDARPGAFLRVDTPAYPSLGPWLADRGLVEVDGGIAMRRGPEQPPPPALPFQTFALASQALG